MVPPELDELLEDDDELEELLDEELLEDELEELLEDDELLELDATDVLLLSSLPPPHAAKKLTAAKRPTKTTLRWKLIVYSSLFFNPKPDCLPDVLCLLSTLQNPPSSCFRSGPDSSRTFRMDTPRTLNTHDSAHPVFCYRKHNTPVSRLCNVIPAMADKSQQKKGKKTTARQVPVKTSFSWAISILHLGRMEDTGQTKQDRTLGAGSRAIPGKHDEPKKRMAEAILLSCGNNYWPLKESESSWSSRTHWHGHPNLPK